MLCRTFNEFPPLSHGVGEVGSGIRDQARKKRPINSLMAKGQAVEFFPSRFRNENII